MGLSSYLPTNMLSDSSPKEGKATLRQACYVCHVILSCSASSFWLRYANEKTKAYKEWDLIPNHRKSGLLSPASTLAALFPHNLTPYFKTRPLCCTSSKGLHTSGQLPSVWHMHLSGREGDMETGPSPSQLHPPLPLLLPNFWSMLFPLPPLLHSLPTMPSRLEPVGV